MLATANLATGAAAAGAAAPRSDPAADQAAIDSMMAEVDRMQVLDPAARERLVQDLRQTEPPLRPLVLQQVRAAMAYRRQTEQREAALAAARSSTGEPFAIRPTSAERPVVEGTRPTRTPPQGAIAADPTGVRRSESVMGHSPSAEPSRTVPATGNSLATDRPTDPAPPAAPVPTTATVPAATAAPAVAPDAATAPAPAPVPVPSPALDAQAAPDRTAPNDRPAATDQPERVEFQSAKPLPGRAVSGPSACIPVTALLPVSPSSDDWQANLAATIRALESSVPRSPQSPDEIAQHARLRMLYLLAGRRDDALRPFPAAPTAMQDVQDFWLNEVYGLVVWFDSQRITDSRRRAEEAKRHLEKAVTRLAEMSPLVVRNLTFVTEVQSFGNYKPSRKAEFVAEEPVLLYAEVDNLKSEETSKGYHTAWRSSYRIFDHRGQMVVDHEPTASEEYCQNPRQDFFIGCQFRLPKRIYPGKHTLHLTVEDLKGQKTGESSIEFTVKQAAD